MQRLFPLLFLAASIHATSVLHSGAHERGFLKQGMRPDVVARTLVQVQDKWRAEAASVAENNATDALQDFETSCGTVVQAVMRASSGDRANVEEYMKDVCSQTELQGWHQASCSSFAAAIDSMMTEDAYDNRESIDTVKLCRKFWAGFAEEERQRVAEERAAREEAEKKAADERAEAEKKAAEERAAAEKKAAEDRAEAERKAAEEAAEAKKVADKEAAKRAAEETAQRAENARKMAEEAAEKLAQKKAEAEKMAEEAKHKMEEAQSAAEETKRFQSEANQTAVAAQKLQDMNQTLHVPENTSFLQKAHSLRHRRKQPMDDDGDQFEHGDMEANARAEDPSDYSVHQFLAHDDGREGSDHTGDSDDGAAAEIAKNKALAKEDHFDSEDTPDNSFLQTSEFSGKQKQPMYNDDGDQFEHGDLEANARSEDPSDYSVHQFLAHDDGREGSDDSSDSDDGAAEEIAKNKALAKEDHFDSEDTPDENSFVQVGHALHKAKQPMNDDDGDEFEHGDLEANARAEDPSDYSVHQFLAHDDGREGSDHTNDDDDGAAAEIAKNKALAKDDHFDSEDTLDDSFFQISYSSKKQPMYNDDGDQFEHGDMEANARAEDPSDYSVHQFLAHDDGREGSDDSQDNDDGAAAEMAKNKALAKEDHFDSEDTPDEDSFVQTKHTSRKIKQPMNDDDHDEFEHGDLEANARTEDPSDYSVHQFLAHDDGREGSDTSGDSDDGAAEEIAKNKALAKQDHFDSEDTPDDSFLQVKSAKKQFLRRKQPMDDDGDEFEHGDMEANARAEDPSDYSVHQFLAHDDGREGSDDSGDSDDGAAAEIAKNKALAKQDHFDSEDTPDTDA